LLLLALALSLRVFYPITAGYFFADDFFNLYLIRNSSPIEYLLTPLGGHLLVTRNALFYVTHALFGTQAEYYYAVVLITHLVNVALMFRVIDLFTNNPRLACFASALWGTCPINDGALGWYSVYGHVVVVTIVLAVLCRLARAANGQPAPRNEPLLWVVLLFMASTSFGIGIGLAVAFPLVAFTLLPRTAGRARATLVLAAGAAVVPVLYFGLHRLYDAMRPDIADPSSFLIAVVTSPGNWGQVFTFLLELIRYGAAAPLGVFLNRFVHLSDAVAAVSIVYLCAVAVAFLCGSPRTRRQLAVCLLLYLSCYAMIAIGRVAYFAQGGKALVETLRYHYAGPIFPIMALCIMLAELDQRLRLPGSAKTALLLVLLTVILGNQIEEKRGKEQLAARAETAQTLRSIRWRIDNTPPNQDVYIENRRFAALGPLNIDEWVPGWAAVFIIFFPENTVDGKRVYFVESNPKVVQAAQRGKRSRTLLVAPNARSSITHPSVSTTCGWEKPESFAARSGAGAEKKPWAPLTTSKGGLTRSFGPCAPAAKA